MSLDAGYKYDVSAVATQACLSFKGSPENCLATYGPYVAAPVSGITENEDGDWKMVNHAMVMASGQEYDYTSFNMYDTGARAQYIAFSLFDSDALENTNLKTGIRMAEMPATNPSELSEELVGKLIDLGIQPVLFTNGLTDDSVGVISAPRSTKQAYDDFQDLAAQVDGNWGWTVDRSIWLRNQDNITELLAAAHGTTNSRNLKYEEFQLIDWYSNSLPVIVSTE
ncbi:MAG: hypothetical protein QNJ09_00630 [Paracoccaceae bacterium]|nr:hypothetical protein [Paracoccaceae bacterium]